MLRRSAVLAASVALGLTATPAPQAWAIPVDLTIVGTWSTNPGSGQPGSGTDLERGQKLVIKTTYDPAVTPITATTVNGFMYYTVDLAGGAAPPNGGGLVSNGNSLDILIPLPGMDAGTPFIYASDEFDHGDYPGDPFPSAVPQVHFRDAAGTDFLGFKLESLNFGPGGNFVQLATEIANIDPGDGIPVPTPSTVADILTDSFQTVIRSINSMAPAVPVQAEAGDPLSYSASSLSATTDGGTFQNPDGTWQDNDLGAVRSDKEDFLIHTWTLEGSVEGGAVNAALVGTDQDAERPHIVVSGPPSGTRTVENVNKMVGILNSGLTTTTDVATWKIAVSEDLTGFDGGTDTILVTYDNADVVINMALATPVGDDLLFELDVDDPDLAINALGLADFELIAYTLLLDGNPFTGLAELLATGSQLVTGAEALALFGAGMHTLEIQVSDRVRALATSPVSAFVTFEVVPEPGLALLWALALAALGWRVRRREEA